jgi:hypothetical protein
VHFRLMAIMALFAGFLSACGSEQTSGNTRLNPDMAASIRKGVTTREQIRTLFGTPQSVKRQVPITPSPGLQQLPARLAASEIWAYWLTRDSHPGIAAKLMQSTKTRHTSFTILIFFDANGIVLDTQVETGQS